MLATLVWLERAEVVVRHGKTVLSLIRAGGVPDAAPSARMDFSNSPAAAGNTTHYTRAKEVEERMESEQSRSVPEAELAWRRARRTEQRRRPRPGAAQMPAPRDPTPSEQAEKDRLKRERLEHVRRSRVSSVGGSVDTLVDTLPASAQLEHGSTLTYHSSEWELMWLENIDAWQLGRICEALDEQQSQVRAFLKDTCSALTDTPWCLIDDSVHHLWYHTLDGRVQASKPRTVKRVSEIRPVSPSDARIWSWFERKNLDTGEVTREFIEPLVSHCQSTCSVPAECALAVNAVT